jgi:hypothetical protein
MKEELCYAGDSLGKNYARRSYVDHGARCDWILPGKIDRGGAINLICPHNTLSKNCLGEATSSYLVDVRKLTMQQMKNGSSNTGGF